MSSGQYIIIVSTHCDNNNGNRDDCDIYNNYLRVLDMLFSFCVRYYYFWLTFLFGADYDNCERVQL